MIKYQNNTISRLYGDNTPAYTLISGGTPIHGEYSQPSTIITINYTPVEWVSNENINTQMWIDLGYVWKNNSRAQLGFQIPSTHSKPNGQQVFGEETVWASDGNAPLDDNNDLRLFFTKSGDNIGAYWDVATSRVQSTIGAITDVWQNWELGNNYIKNLSNNSNFVTGSTYNISRQGDIGLYGACQNLNTGRTDCVRYSYVKIYEGDTLIKDIIPVLDDNSIPCFFDKISLEFFYYKVNGEPSTGLTYGNVGEQSGITINYNTDLTTLTYDTPSGIIDTKTNLNASANTGVKLIYSSDDTSIATVDASGVVAPKASGTTTITIIAPTTTIGNTTYRGVQKRLKVECEAPSHTELEYLITDKNNPVRIDTGYYLKDNTIIKVKAKWDVNYAYLAHTEDGNVNRNHFYMSYGSSTREFYFCVYPTREWQSDRGYSAISPHSVEFGRYKVYIDDSLKYNGDLGQISDWSYPIILFGEQNNFKGNFNLYYFQIFEGETLVKSFKPVIDSEGVVCLYEEVNKQYYYTSIGSFGHS